MIVDDYIDACNTYRGKYGDATVCLFQIGDFFEMNAYHVHKEDGTTQLVGADIYTVCDMCNMQVTRKNKSVIETSRNNPLMAGFPLAALQKYASILLANMYTVVVVRQVSPPPNVVRKVTDIWSPSMVLNPTTSDANVLMCIVFDQFRSLVPNHHTHTHTQKQKHLMTVGIAGIDVSTGKCFAYEAYSHTDDPNYAYDEVRRLMEAYVPKEVCVYEPMGIDSAAIRNIEHCLHSTSGSGCGSGSGTVVHRSTMHHERKPAFQDEIIARAYVGTGGTGAGGTGAGGTGAHVIDQYPLAKLAFTCMLQFSYEHDANIITKIQLPTILEQSKYLTLQSNSAAQLQVIGGSSGEKPLADLLNRASTSFGRRLFKERLLAPVHDCSVLDARYNAIDCILLSGKGQEVGKHLSQVHDVERLARRLQLGTLSPMEWPSLHDSLAAAERALACLPDTYEGCTYIVKHIERIREAYVNVLDIEHASKYTLSDIKGSVFKRGYDSEIDKYEDRLIDAHETLNMFQRAISSIEPCVIDANERDGYYITITKKRWDNVQKQVKHVAVGVGVGVEKVGIATFEARPVSSSSSMLKLSHPDMNVATNTILECHRILQVVTTRAYVSFLNTFEVSWNDAILEVVTYLAELDVVATCARNAHEYGYVRPRIVPSHMGASCSYVHAKNMRHPIIERIHTDVEYVPNDVDLGVHTNGILLYGLNASGKSAYMKSVGLNVIMAQAGMYVAAESMTLAPFHSIFTRIQNNDNLYKRMSSFTVEMTELRNIFQRCNKNSLVLGDELCSGTEFVSATSIVAAGTHHLLERQVKFLFATHLHELCDISLIKERVTTSGTSATTTTSGGPLRIVHMHVDIAYGEHGDAVITYHRKLKEGSGSKVYGLEVCEALGMPDMFIKTARGVRNHVMGVSAGMLDPSDVSRYNSGLYVGDKVCGVCGLEKACDVHHIQYKCNGGSNRMSNLVPLCKRCHDEQHHGGLDIKGYVATSRGRELVYEYNANHDHDHDDSSVEMRDLGESSVHVHHLKQYIRYGISGWQMKRTVRSKWTPITQENAVSYIKQKLAKQSKESKESKESFVDVESSIDTIRSALTVL